MGFFQTLGTGYKIMGSELKLGWQKHGSHILTGGGTGLMLLGGILMGRRGTTQEVQQAIADAEKVIAEVKADQARQMYGISAPAPVISSESGTSGETGTEVPKAEEKVISANTKPKKFRLARAKAQKLWTVGKHFWREAAVEIVGAGLVTAGHIMDTNDKSKLATGLAVTAAEFAAYRANVIADQGEAKDLEYLTTKQEKGVKKVTAEDGTVFETTNPDGGDITVKADPSAFKFWCSPETCPSVYSDNLDMTKLNLECIEGNLTRMLRMNGHLYLNDMRREFGGLTPKKMDVPLGGIFGKICDRSKPETLKYIDLGWRADTDFMEGRKVGVWIIFPCDPEPIVSKVNPKLAAVEDVR